MFLREVIEQYIVSQPKPEVVMNVNQKFIDRDIKKIKRQLMKNASNHIAEVRLEGEVHPQVIHYFVKEGFCVWENSLVTVIKLPQGYKAR